MRQIKLSYEGLKQEMIREISKHKVIVLATSDGEIVTARTVNFWYACDGLKIYCNSGSNKRKCWQINKNPNVALAAGNIQIEGVASLRGHPLNERNNTIIDNLREKQLNLYETLHRAWSQRDFELIEIVPRRIALWKSARPQSYLDILLVDREEAYRVKTRDTGEAPAYRE